jgi:hypothetical protein
MEYRQSESLNKPVAFDDKSSKAGIYVRFCVEEKERKDDDGIVTKYYTYVECYMTNTEWEEYKLVKKIQGDNLDIPTMEYDYKMQQAVEYPVSEGGNGFTYKPIWAEKVYASKIATLTAFPELLPIAIYDTTNKEERMQKMTLEQLKALTLYLGNIQLQYFDEKKRQQAENN